jgi:hypothetical protein
MPNVLFTRFKQELAANMLIRGEQKIVEKDCTTQNNTGFHIGCLLQLMQILIRARLKR